MAAIANRQMYVGEVAFQGLGEASATTNLVTGLTGIASVAIDMQSMSITTDNNVITWRRGGLVKGKLSMEVTTRISCRAIIISVAGSDTEAYVHTQFKPIGYSAAAITGEMVIATFQNFDAANVVWLEGLQGIVLSGGYELAHGDPNPFTFEIEINPNLDHGRFLNVVNVAP